MGGRKGGSGMLGRVRGFLRVGGKPPMGGKVSSCCVEGFVVPDVNGAYTIEVPDGAHDFWYAAHGAVGQGRRVECAGGETRIADEMDLLPWPRINAVAIGDPCPRHPETKLRRAETTIVITLDDFEAFALFPFPGDPEWGRCLPEF